MLEGRAIWVVIPAFEEERLIGRTLASIPPFVDRVVVVDDASPDRTSQVVQEFRDSRIDLVRRTANGGVGAAIVDGYRAFLAHGGASSDACAVMAGDAQMDPGDLARLVGALGSTAGYAKGNRFLHADGYGSMPFLRIVGNRLLSWLTRLATGLRSIGDSQCGYTVATRSALQAIDLSTLYPRYGFPNDMLVKFAVRRVRVVDVPVRAIYGDEVSGIDPFVVVPRIAGILWRGWREIRRARRARGDRGSSAASDPVATKAPTTGSVARPV